MMAKKERKEARTKQVQVVVPQHLADAVRLRASSEGVSINQYANNAIASYMESGGDDIVADNNCRLVLMMQPSKYQLLAEMAKAQGISTIQAINHALETKVTGKPSKDYRQQAVTYMVDMSHLRSQMQRLVSDVNEIYGGCRKAIQTIESINKQELPTKRDKKNKTKYEKAVEEREADIDREVKILMKMFEKLQEKIDAISSEQPPSVADFSPVGDYAIKNYEPKSVE